jgi:hypothetical protein
MAAGLIAYKLRIKSQWATGYGQLAIEDQTAK